MHLTLCLAGPSSLPENWLCTHNPWAAQVGSEHHAVSSGQPVDPASVESYLQRSFGTQLEATKVCLGREVVWEAGQWVNALQCSFCRNLQQEHTKHGPCLPSLPSSMQRLLACSA